MAKRIQMTRHKPWRKDYPDAVIVARPSRWGNPFKVGDRSPQNYGVVIDRCHAVDLFRELCEAKREAGVLDEWLEPLRGKDLACWCPLEDTEGNRVPCHADVLLEIANAPR